jgi:hypothetical protein
MVPMFRRMLIAFITILTVLNTIGITTPVQAETGGPTPSGYVVLFHPDNGLFVNDQVSFQVLAPPGENMSGLGYGQPCSRAIFRLFPGQA